MKIVACYSGGLDSTVLLWYLQREGHTVHALSVNYGQRHEREIHAAADITTRATIPFTSIDLSSLSGLFGQSALTDRNTAVPHGHYEEESMKATVVPNRNMILISVAAALSMAEGYGGVAFAAHSGDHTIYPDCRPEFVEAMGVALGLSDWNPVKLVAPFLSMSKAGICALGHEIGAPLELTWSCYEGGNLHCGKCGTCVERREAFEVAGVPDPTKYRVE